jgi:hypothetical protein
MTEGYRVTMEAVHETAKAARKFWTKAMPVLKDAYNEYGKQFTASDIKDDSGRYIKERVESRKFPFIGQAKIVGGIEIKGKGLSEGVRADFYTARSFGKIKVMGISMPLTDDSSVLVYKKWGKIYAEARDVSTGVLRANNLNVENELNIASSKLEILSPKK